MSIVNSIETVRDWLTAEVCPLVKLKLPDDNATDASYPYKLVNPAAFSLFVPSKDRTPPNIAAPIPSVCVQIVQGDDDLLQSARDIKIRLCFSAWDPGYHGPDIFKPKGDGSGTYIQQYNEAAASYFVKNGEGWRDAWNFVDTALRLIENAEYLGDLRVIKEKGITFTWDDALLDASADEEYVLLYTLEGAELWLNVLDPNSGAAVQRLELTAGMPEDEREALEDYGIDALGVRQYASDGGTVFFIRALRDWAVAADYSEGRYAPQFTAAIDRYAADLSLFTMQPADCAWDGERLCTLYAQRNLLPWETGADKRGYALVVQGAGGTEYVGVYNRPGNGAGYGGTCEIGFAVE